MASSAELFLLFAELIKATLMRLYEGLKHGLFCWNPQCFKNAYGRIYVNPTSFITPSRRWESGTHPELLGRSA